MAQSDAHESALSPTEPDTGREAHEAEHGRPEQRHVPAAEIPPTVSTLNNLHRARRVIE